MAKVRIYDLAKEFGMKSKDLADRLITLGYPIINHSSTVEKDMAADIRKKIGGGAVSVEIPVGRIEPKGRAEDNNPWGKTVIRRRSKADKEEAVKQQELAETRALEEEAQAAEARLLDKMEADSVQDLEVGTVAAPDVEESVSAVSKGAEADVAEEVVQAVPELEETLEQESPEETADRADHDLLATDQKVVADATDKESPAVQAGGDDAVSKQDEQQDEQAVQKDEPVIMQQERPKPLAKIVGRVVIPTPSEPVRPEPRRPSRPAASKAGGRSAPPQPDPTIQDAGAKAGAADGRGKKKGRRVVAIHSEDEAHDRRSARGARKGKGGRENFIQESDGDFVRHRKGKRKKDSRAERDVTVVAETRAIKRRIRVVETISVGELAKRMSVKASEVIAALMRLGVMATLNQALDVDTASLVASDFGFEVEQAMHAELEVEALQELEVEQGGEALPRPPVVTVMGHVDHGKTSILDAIRKTDVALGEAGGITQHIGAYHVQSPSGSLTFVDTPGHAAFTEMRSRGAKVTDIVVLVVAADDGVMEQTKEAIAHAKAAEVPIVVAVNKIDKDGADPERVRRELSDFGLIPEAWGGQTIYCETSAKKGDGIPNLLESIQLQAEILELRADPTRKARGVVIEAQLHKGRGPVATVLVQEGTLQPGDNYVAGMFSGRVRLLTNERGEQVEKAGPSIPVEVQGLSGVPQAGDEFVVLTDEKMAKSVAAARQLKARETELAAGSKVSLDNLFEKIAEQEVKELRVILRADVQGTLEAFGQAAENLSTETIRVRSLHEGTGSITESDIHLAAASDAIIIGFNVRPSVKVKELAEQEGVDVRSYDVIYHALEDIEKAMKGMLEPTYEERVIGTAEVRDTFQVPKVGLIAGCAVISGKILRNARVRVLRDGVVVYTGKIGSLKRFKDDAKEVLTGFECGIGVENYNDIKLGDHLEAFVLDEVEATL
ncbi:MAG: translation initiation factor IF-2 [Desulfobulbaceae bacterium]|nr:translation initiation factor IF-2 [Desulfobulbaceae bacterium]